MRIFISVASYCDPVLGFTLERALELARRPEQLHFGVVEQSPDSLARPIAADLQPARLSYLRIDPLFARGPCWARAIAMSFYDGEDWFFQIDSHMDFEQDWDARLIDQAQALLPARRGVVVSAYPDAFVFQDGTPQHRPTTRKVLAHAARPGTQFADDHLVLGFEAHPVETDQPVEGFHLGAGCLFAPGAFATAFPYDPQFYFHGEEQALALRLYTHGWDMFHMPGLPVWHLYNNGESGAAPRPLHWDEDLDSQRSRTWWQLEQQSRQRLSDLVDGKPLGVFGLGRERTLADYAAFSGIDYAARTLGPRAFHHVQGQA